MILHQLNFKLNQVQTFGIQAPMKLLQSLTWFHILHFNLHLPSFPPLLSPIPSFLPPLYLPRPLLRRHQLQLHHQVLQQCHQPVLKVCEDILKFAFVIKILYPFPNFVSFLLELCFERSTFNSVTFYRKYRSKCIETFDKPLGWRRRFVIYSTS